MKVAILDFDGTLSDKYMTHEFIVYLFEKGLFDESFYWKQVNNNNALKQGQKSYLESVYDFGHFWAQGVKGQKKEDIRAAAKEFFEEYRYNIYPSSYELADLLKEAGYKTIMVAAGAREVIKLAAAALEVHELHAIELEVEKGVYTGEITNELHKPNAKKELVKEFKKNKNLDWEGSIAFGDTKQDLPLLEAVEIPVALNADRELESVAKSNGYKQLTHESVIRDIKKMLGVELTKKEKAVGEDEMPEIRRVVGRQVLDSRGNPTVEVELYTQRKSARAIVPSGASKGKNEALELRDEGEEYNGKSVHKAIKKVEIIDELLKGKDVRKQKELDFLMIEKDSTSNKKELGANSILGASMAMARLAAKEKNMPLFEHLNSIIRDIYERVEEEAKTMKLPVPFMNIINGGMHADNPLDFQEYMLVPQGETFSESLRIGTEVYHELKRLLKEKGLSTGVGDEGGFAPQLESYEEPLKLIMQAAKNLGYEDKVKLAMDIAASDIYKDEKYVVEGKKLSASELSDLYGELIDKYPIISIEDPFDEEDFEAFAEFTKKYGDRIKVVGDDLLVTNVERVRDALSKGACNTLLLKVNQIGTLTEAIKAAQLAFKHEWGVMVSHRSGETEDSFIADLVVALGAGMIKTGAPCRGERTAKYNQLLRIEETIKEFGM